LPASLLAGGLWTAFGPEVTFGVAGSVALLALLYFLAIRPPLPKKASS
jgi:hypothetical protein